MWLGWGGGVVWRRRKGGVWVGWLVRVGVWRERGCVCVVQRWISVKRSVEIVLARRGQKI